MKFYLLQNGQQAGPYFMEQVQQMLAAGQIHGEDLAWREGQTEWTPLSSLIFVPDSASVPPPGPPPVPFGGAKPVKTGSQDLNGVAIALIGFGVIILILLGLGVGTMMSQIGKIQASGHAYVDDYMSHIAPQWSSDEFMKRVTPEYRGQFDSTLMQAMFKKLSSLGNFKGGTISDGNSSVNYTGTGKHVFANYVDKATFQNGTATFTILLVQVGGKWTIAEFHVESPIFLK